MLTGVSVFAAKEKVLEIGTLGIVMSPPERFVVFVVVVDVNVKV